jgi:hypothetical protein
MERKEWDWWMGEMKEWGKGNWGCWRMGMGGHLCGEGKAKGEWRASPAPTLQGKRKMGRGKGQRLSFWPPPFPHSSLAVTAACCWSSPPGMGLKKGGGLAPLPLNRNEGMDEHKEGKKKGE